MKDTFTALLAAAPEHHESDTVVAIGTLARTQDADKFVLIQSDGYAVTLDASAVKTHMVIGSSFGQQIVKVELDAKQIPSGTFLPRPADSSTNNGNDYKTNDSDHHGPWRF